MSGGFDPASPGEKGGIGLLTNDNAGGVASLSYVARDVPRDFYLESRVYITITGEEQGPLQGLVFLADPSQARFYRLAGRFTADQELSVAYVGRDTFNFPLFVKTRKGEELPGGPLAANGWHRLGVEVVGSRGEF